MSAFMPGEIQMQMERERRRDIRTTLFVLVMLVLAPIVVLATVLASLL